jgi:hypothetical protein
MKRAQWLCCGGGLLALVVVLLLPVCRQYPRYWLPRCWPAR